MLFTDVHLTHAHVCFLMSVVWVAVLCGLAGRCVCFGGTYCLWHWYIHCCENLKSASLCSVESYQVCPWWIKVIQNVNMAHHCVMVEWLTFLLLFREVMGSILGPATGYPDCEVFLWFSPVPPGKCQDSTSQLGRGCFLPSPLQFIIFHLSSCYRCYIL
jgi:hypothetical protein